VKHFITKQLNDINMPRPAGAFFLSNKKFYLSVTAARGAAIIFIAYNCSI